jgi:hypothetical protein
MVSHGPRRRMGHCVHFSALAPLRTDPMCAIAHISEVPQSGRRSKAIRRTPSLSDRGLCRPSENPVKAKFAELPFHTLG